MFNFVFLILNATNATALLWLQLGAYRKHHHKSFMLLVCSTVIAMFSVALSALPSFMLIAANQYVQIYVTSIILYCVYAGLALWGVASLFQSYEELAKRAAEAER